jgi:hypothetical protein
VSIDVNPKWTFAGYGCSLPNVLAGLEHLAERERVVDWHPSLAVASIVLLSKFKIGAIEEKSFYSFDPNTAAL